MTFELIEPESFDFNFFITLQWPYKRKVKEIITNVNVEYCSSKTTFTRSFKFKGWPFLVKPTKKMFGLRTQSLKDGSKIGNF